MEPSRAHHISEDTIERYSMNRLEEEELAKVEEHLLVCAECQDRVADSDGFVRGMRRAAARERAQRAVSPAARWWRPALGIAAAAAVLIAAGLQIRRTAAPAVAVILEASRGPSPAHAAAPTHRRLALWLDVADLPPTASYRMEIVDSTGGRVSEGVATPRDGRAEADVPGLPAKGRYYVRLYSPSSELLREYGLEGQ